MHDLPFDRAERATMHKHELAQAEGWKSEAIGIMVQNILLWRSKLTTGRCTVLHKIQTKFVTTPNLKL